MSKLTFLLAAMPRDEFDDLVEDASTLHYGDEFDDLVGFDDDASYGGDYDGDDYDGDDYDGDDYDGDGYGGDGYGALDRGERREFRDRRRQMRRGNKDERRDLRQWRRDQRKDNDQAPGGPGGGGPIVRKKHLFSNATAVTAAAFTLTVTPYTKAVLEDFTMSGPANTVINTIMVGDRAILPSGSVDIAALTGASFMRDLAAGFAVDPGVPIVITGVGGGSGTVGALFKAHGPASC